MLRRILVLILAIGLIACQRKQNTGDDHDHDHSSHSHSSEVSSDPSEFMSHDHSHDEDGHSHEDVNITLFNNHYELFVVSPPMEGHGDIEMIAHITKLSNYKPVNRAALSVKVMDQNKNELHTFKFDYVDEGTYKGSLHFHNDGEYPLEFQIATNNKPIKFEYVAHVGHSHGEAQTGDITFTKEQAWKTKFGTMEVVPQDFSLVVKTSGEMLPARGDFQSVTALSSGFVSFKQQNLDNGTKVISNQVLFSISGQGLTENNIDSRFATISNQYEVSKSNYERKKTLFEESIVSAKDYEAAKAKYNTDSVLYFTLLQSFSTKGLNIKSPMSGNIYQLNVSDGDYVEEGQILAHVVANNKLRIHADLPQKHYDLLTDINSIHFKPAYSEQVYTLEELNGRLISKGSYADLNAGFIPVIFEVENNNFLAGAYAECWLLTKKEANQLVVPRSALIEEQGNYYVFVQHHGENYEKRAVQFDAADGKNVRITYGLSFGDRIVHKGAMTLKVASLAAEVPVHSHDH